jgi:signal transduction histidine kinase
MSICITSLAVCAFCSTLLAEAQSVAQLPSRLTSDCHNANYPGLFDGLAVFNPGSPKEFTVPPGAWVRHKRRLKLKIQAEHHAEVDKLKTAFLTNLSHEFRTPLTLLLAPLRDFCNNARSDEEKVLLNTIDQKRRTNAPYDKITSPT